MSMHNWLSAMGLALALGVASPGQAAVDACVPVLQEAAGKDPMQLAGEFEKQFSGDTSELRPLWAAATLLRCSAAAMSDAGTQCATAGRARALYSKFDEAAQARGPKPWKKELADARKSADALTLAYAASCAKAAHAAKNAGQHEAAANLFEATYQLTDKAVHLYNAARVCELGKLRNEAVVFYTAYLALPGPWLDRRDAVTKLVQLQRQLASDTSDQVRQAQQLAEAARAAAQRAEALASQAQSQARAAETRAVAAETRAVESNQRAQAADQRSQAADRRATEAETRVAQAESRVRTAESAAADAGRRAAEAQQRAQQAAAQAQQAAQRAETAEAQLRQALDTLRQQQEPAPGRGR
ncbi:MAG: hypothetical protein FJ100_00900 [Deltaproteobacteria bacterium]|nr:hypothetical protein [Deltaproteobacteria bacterium]